MAFFEELATIKPEQKQPPGDTFFESLPQEGSPSTFFESIQQNQILQGTPKKQSFFEEVSTTIPEQEQLDDDTVLARFKQKFPNLEIKIDNLRGMGLSAIEVINTLSTRREGPVDPKERLTTEDANFEITQMITGMTDKIKNATKTALRDSATAILLGQGLTLEEIQEREKQEPDLLFDIYQSVLSIAGDIPAMITGGILGGLAGGKGGAATGGLLGTPFGPGGIAAGAITGGAVGSAIGGGAGALALPAAIKSTYVEWLKHKNGGGNLTWEQFMESAGIISKEAGKSGLIGGLLGSVGLTPLKGVGKFAGEVGALEAGKVATEWEVPTAKDLIDDVITLGALKVSSGLSRNLVKRATRNIKDIGQGQEALVEKSLQQKKPINQMKAKEISSTIDKAPLKSSKLPQRVTMEQQQQARQQNIINILKGQKQTPEVKAEIANRQSLLDASKRRTKSIQQRLEVENNALRPEKTPKGFSQSLKEDVKPNPQANLTAKQQKLLEKAVSRNDFDPERVGALSKFYDNFNIERPFQRAGAPETGFRAKNYYSTRQSWEERTIKQTSRLKKFTPEEQSKLVLLAEKGTPPTDPRMAEGYKIMREYFDGTFKELQKEGVLKNPFPQNKIERLKRETASLKVDLESAKGTKANNIKAKIAENNKQLNELKDLKFVSIPARLWFEKISEMEPERQTRIIQMLTSKKRETISIQSLIDKKIIDPKDVNAVEIMGYYGRRAGKDIALSKILNAGKKEGLLSDTPKKGFVVMPFDKFPTLKRVYAHPYFSDFLGQLLNPNPRNLFDRASATLKSASFYNPLVMPSNDIFQSSMLVLGDVVRKPTNIKNIPRSMKTAFKSTMKQDANYWEAYDNGLFSQPFNMPFDNYQRLLQKNMSKGGFSFANILGKATPKKAFENIYGVISGTAWSLDRAIRMFSYEYLKNKGLSPRESGQIASLFHGDYARVAPNMRRQLNRFFYTPTFKIVMSQLYADMIRKSGQYGKLALKGQKVPEAAKTVGAGLIGTAVVNYAFDSFLNSLGFKTEQFARKYTKKVEDDAGVEQDLNLSLSTPANLPLKFFYRGAESFEPGQEAGLASFLKKNQFELNRMVLIAKRFMDNQKFNGEEIYDVFGDDASTQVAKTTKWLAQEALPLLYALGADDTPTQQKAREQMDKEVGKLFRILPFSFGYLTEPNEVRKLRKAQNVLNTLIGTEKRRILQERKPLTEEQKQNYLNEIDRVLNK